jgi:hypothetical protein
LQISLGESSGNMAVPRARSLQSKKLPEFGRIGGGHSQFSCLARNPRWRGSSKLPGSRERGETLAHCFCHCLPASRLLGRGSISFPCFSSNKRVICSTNDISFSGSCSCAACSHKRIQSSFFSPFMSKTPHGLKLRNALLAGNV